MTATERKAAEPTGTLLSDAMRHVSSLVRSEVDLARAEVDENLRNAGRAIGLLVGAVVIVMVALNVLAAALVSALVEAGLQGNWAALIVGISLAVVAVIMMNKGKNDLKLSSLAPTRATENVKRDVSAIQGARSNG